MRNLDRKFKVLPVHLTFLVLDLVYLFFAGFSQVMRLG